MSFEIVAQYVDTTVNPLHTMNKALQITWLLVDVKMMGKRENRDAGYPCKLPFCFHGVSNSCNFN